MQLVSTPDSQAPEGAIVQSVRTRDRIELRCARFMPEGMARGTVLIASGRAEQIEKYYETVRDLLARQFCVVVFDWRGQGLSQRLLRDRGKGHVMDFDAYQLDLDAVLSQVMAPHCPTPWFALGHSMGGAILIDHAHEEASPFERIVLCAPMIDLVLRTPRLARVAARLLPLLGLARAYVPTGGPKPVVARGFGGNPLTSDVMRFTRLAKLLSDAPELSLGDPTVGWVRAAFKLMAKFAHPDHARAIRTPMLVFAPQDDVVTDSFATERYCANLKTGRLIWMAGARHEILMERDEIRARFWAAFDAFIPGMRAEAEALVARHKQDA